MEKKTTQTSKSIIKNALFGFSTWILPLGLSFIATRIIVKSLGNEDYGIYTLVLGFVGYSFNFNVGRAITKYIAEYLPSGDSEKIKDVISTTFLLNIFFSILGASLICLMANWLVKDIFLITKSSQEKTIYAFYIASAILFFTMLNQVFNSILQGIQRFDVYSKIFNFQNILLLSGNIILAVNKFGINALLIWNLTIILLSCCVVYYFSKKLLPDFKIQFNFKFETLKLVLKYTIGVIIYQILSNFLLLFERGWVIRKFGEESLTFYVIPLMLGIYIHSFITSLVFIIFPLASELNQEKERLQRLYLKATKIICFFVIFIGTTMVILRQEVLLLWVGQDIATHSTDLLILHTITFSLLAIQTVSWQVTEGLGYPLYNSFIFIFCLVIGLPLMIYFTNDYGSLGVAMGRLIGFFVLFLSVFYVEKWFFQKVQIKFWFKVLGLLGLAAILAGVSEKLLIAKIPQNWLTLILTILVGGIIYCLALFFMGFIEEDDKQLFKSAISR